MVFEASGGQQGSEHDIRATYAGAKRRIAALEQQIEGLQNMGAKRRSDLASNVTQGRVIGCLVSMFQSIEELVDENDRQRELQLDSSSSSSEVNIDEKRTYRGYRLLIHHIAGLEEKLTALDVAELSLYFKELRKGASGAHGDDTANLKPAVVSWIVAMFEKPTVPLAPSNKSDRGFEHDITGQLLCPIDYCWNDEVVRQKIHDGHPDFIVTADLWPAFLYPHAMGDTGDVEHGLFQSAILVKGFKFLFTSPTSSEDINTENDIEESQALRSQKRSRGSRKAPTRGNVANLLGMRSVTPRAIAYVAVQIRFSISSATSWNETDGCFSYPVFYNNIVDFFENTPGPAAQAQVESLLVWWTAKVFGKHRIPPQAQSRPTGSSVSKLAVQRAVREQERRTTGP